MKLKFTAIASLTIVAASTLILGSCTADADSSGLEFMPDMYRSPAIEPYVDYGEIRGRENKAVKMKLSAFTPPSYTIPYYGTDSSKVMMMLPYHRKAMLPFRETHGMYGVDLSANDEYLASAVDVNPFKLTATNSEEIFKAGKTLFASNCAHCHGDAGDGNGPMVASGAYAGVPNYKNLTITEGQMFYSIYYGKGAMGSHSSILNKKEIWTLVHYVKKFQNAEYGKFDANGAVAVPASID
ncbi:MAG: cytochrome c [Flavobacteriia bacterium]|nr:cytochrome c [Flavobacteriia bacterium]